MGIVTDIVLPLVLAFMMFTLGLGLRVSNFGRLLTQPRSMVTGLVFQILLLPLVGFLLISSWPLAPEIAMGVMLIAVAPGGVTSNFLTSLARGDVALSVSLTAITSLLSVVTIPLVLGMAYQQIVGDALIGDVSIGKMAISIFLIVTVPVLVGMAVRHFSPGLTGRCAPYATKLSTLFFVIVLAGAILQERENIAAYFAEAGLVTLALNIMMMVLAFFGARALGSTPEQHIAICIECGLQNGTLAIAVGVLIFGGGAYIIPAATYSLIMFATGLVFLWLARRVLMPVINAA